MALKYFNVRSRETVVADTEPKIAALWGSSDRSPNVSQGQDFGWRLAPEVVVELKQIKGDITQLRNIATDFNVSVQEVTEHMILQFISAKTNLEDAPVADDADYTDEYNEAIRRLTQENLEALAKEMAKKAIPTTTTTTTESLEDLEKRVALQERLAAAKAALAEDTSDTLKSGGNVADYTTTTTTVAPSTTTTTTKKK